MAKPYEIQFESKIKGKIIIMGKSEADVTRKFYNQEYEEQEIIDENCIITLIKVRKQKK